MNKEKEANSNFYDVMKETLEVLKKVEGDFFEKLPEHIKETLLKYSKNSQKIVNLDMSKKINEQDISEECKDLLSIIYYISANDESEKRKLLKCWNENMKE